MKPAIFVPVLAMLGTLSTAFAGWQRLPHAEQEPVNLANKSIPGTTIKASHGIENAGALISDGAKEAASIGAGKSGATIQLAGIHLVDFLTFTNDGAEGKVSVATSVDATKWVPSGQAVFGAKDRLVAARFAPSQARYVKVDFEASTAGSIRCFSVAGATTDKSYKGEPLNLAGGIGGSRAIYAFPEPANAGEKDANLNVFKFPRSKDRYRIVVYDLGSLRTIKNFSAAYSNRPTRTEVFAFKQLPEKEDWRGKKTLDPAIFEQEKPVAAGEDARGLGHITVTPSKPIAAQYVALRFEPNYNRKLNAGIDTVSDFFAMAMEPYTSIAREAGILPAATFVAADSGDDDEFVVGGGEITNADGSNVQLNFNANGGPGSGNAGGNGGEGGGGQGGQGNNDQPTGPFDNSLNNSLMAGLQSIGYSSGAHSTSGAGGNLGGNNNNGGGSTGGNSHPHHRTGNNGGGGGSSVPPTSP